MEKNVLNYRIIIEQDEDGVYVASIPSLQGCYTEGDTFEEVIQNHYGRIKKNCLNRCKHPTKFQKHVNNA